MVIVLQILLVVWVFRLLTNVFRLCATKFYFYLFKNNYKHLNRCSRPVGVLFSKANTQQYVFCTERRYSVKEMYQDYISNCLTDRHSSNWKCNLDTFLLPCILADCSCKCFKLG